MTLALDDKWIWDSWFVQEGGRHHAYFLQAYKSLGNPDLRHFNVSQGHAVSSDLINWTHLGTCFSPSAGPAFDDLTTWTGSVVQGPDGVWHLFYTGGGSAEAGLYQRIGHATSRDLHSWNRVKGGLCLDLVGPNARHYEATHDKSKWRDRSMRDPWVMADPEGDGWIMYFTARAAGIAEPEAGGCVGFATSQDLKTWHLQPPVFTGGFAQIEVPQVFNVGSRWYCLFCTSAADWSKAQIAGSSRPPVTGTHYLTADSPRGPWTIAPGFLDGDLPCRRYASRMIETVSGWVIMGFADGGTDNFGGYVMDPEPVVFDADGYMSVSRSA